MAREGLPKKPDLVAVTGTRLTHPQVNVHGEGLTDGQPAFDRDGDKAGRLFTGGNKRNFCFFFPIRHYLLSFRTSSFPGIRAAVNARGAE